MTDEIKGRAKGGKAVAAKMTSEERQERARNAAKERWNPVRDVLPEVKYPGELEIGGVKIPCAVLDNGERIISETGIANAILGGRSGASIKSKRNLQESGGAHFPVFLASKNLIPFISAKLDTGALAPVEYRDGRRKATGFKATMLPSACEIWLEARAASVLNPQQLEKAQKAEILMRGLAHVGINALVDEATGYQEIRDKRALQAILDAFLSKELAAWAKRFPDEFYQQIFRLRGWEWRGRGFNPPQIVSYYTKDIVYARLAPGILDELEKLNPIDNGKRKAKHHQWLTHDVGHPALAQHVHTVIAFMRVSQDWTHFKHLLDTAFPKKGDTLMLPMMIDP